MRVAFFGGTFDPPHRGHLAIARAAADRLHLDKIYFAPVGRQPLKAEASSTFEDRLAMVKLAIDGDDRFAASTLDAARSDGRPNYTIDVISRLKSSLQPEDQVFCIVGADSFLDFPRWHHAPELLFQCSFIVAARPGFQLEDIQKALPQGLNLTSDPQPAGDIVEFPFTDGNRTSVLYLMPDLQIEISATEIRAAIADTSSASEMLPEKVAEYIRSRQLYC